MQAVTQTNPFAHGSVDGPRARDATTASDARTFVTFELAAQWLAVDVTHVREILDRQAMTPLPKAPSDVDGMIDVRGSAVTVVNLAQRLGIIGGADSADTRFLVFEFTGAEGDCMTIAVKADKVLEVSQIAGSAIEDTPETGSHLDRNIIEGVTRSGERLVVIVNLAGVFPSSPSPASAGGMFDFD